MGLARRLRDADVVVTHTGYVADGVRAYAKRGDITVVPHPAQVGMLRHARTAGSLPDEPARWAGHFGVLRRRYKGSDVVAELARRPVDGWGIVAVGVGARADTPGLYSVPGYVRPGELVGTVASTDVTLAPYRFATQSGVVVLAHLLGSVPIASSVGGIPEQIEHDVDGLLLAPGATVDDWRAALELLSDDDTRKDLAVAGTARAWREHEAFIRGITVMTQ
jgi:glycosyltransferase involved in cell wall biosynthesis